MVVIAADKQEVSGSDSLTSADLLEMMESCNIAFGLNLLLLISCNFSLTNLSLLDGLSGRDSKEKPY